MIENLDYIYLAMYILDLYDNIHTFSIVVNVISVVVVVVSCLVFFTVLTEPYTEEESKVLCKKIIKYFGIVLVIFSLINVILPSKNTVKVFFGVKAAQAVMTYIDDSTIPERTKKTVDNLWNRVDNYLTTIDIDSTATAAVSNSVSNTVDSTITKTIEETIKN